MAFPAKILAFALFAAMFAQAITITAGQTSPANLGNQYHITANITDYVPPIYCNAWTSGSDGFIIESALIFRVNNEASADFFFTIDDKYIATKNYSATVKCGTETAAVPFTVGNDGDNGLVKFGANFLLYSYSHPMEAFISLLAFFGALSIGGYAFARLFR